MERELDVVDEQMAWALHDARKARLAGQEPSSDPYVIMDLARPVTLRVEWARRLATDDPLTALWLAQEALRVLGNVLDPDAGRVLPPTRAAELRGLVAACMRECTDAAARAGDKDGE